VFVVVFTTKDGDIRKQEVRASSSSEAREIVRAKHSDAVFKSVVDK